MNDMKVLVCAAVLTFTCICCITNCDAWWFDKKAIKEYLYKDCSGKRYWTYNQICCDRVIHNRLFHEDECCERLPYNPRLELCCDGISVSKADYSVCPSFEPKNDIMLIRGRKRHGNSTS